MVFKKGQENIAKQIGIRKKLSESKMGSKNPMWQGDDVGYGNLHAWVRRNKSKPPLCEKCKEKEPYDVANISGEYKRDIDDYEWLCRKCHMLGDGRYDKAISNLKKDKTGKNNPNWKGGKMDKKIERFCEIIEAFVDENFEAESCSECHEIGHPIVPNDFKGSYKKELIKLFGNISKIYE